MLSVCEPRLEHLAETAKTTTKKVSARDRQKEWEREAKRGRRRHKAQQLCCTKEFWFIWHKADLFYFWIQITKHTPLHTNNNCGGPLGGVAGHWGAVAKSAILFVRRAQRKATAAATTTTKAKSGKSRGAKRKSLKRPGQSGPSGQRAGKGRQRKRCF